MALGSDRSGHVIKSISMELTINGEPRQFPALLTMAARMARKYYSAALFSPTTGLIGS